MANTSSRFSPMPEVDRRAAVGIDDQGYLSGARLPQGNFFGSVLNDDTSTYRSAHRYFAGTAKDVGGTMISAMGNKYTPIGQAEVDKVRNAGDINSVLMTGYENNIANLSNTYDHAQNQLINKVRELIAQLSFKDPTRNAAIQQQIQNLQRSWDPQAGTFSGYDPKLNPTYFPDHGASPLNHPNTGGMASTMGGIPTADYLSGARLPQGNFFGSVLNDDTSTYRSAPKGAMTLPTATKMGSQARLKSGTSGGSSAGAGALGTGIELSLLPKEVQDAIAKNPALYKRSITPAMDRAHGRTFNLGSEDEQTKGWGLMGPADPDTLKGSTRIELADAWNGQGLLDNLGWVPLDNTINFADRRKWRPGAQEAILGATKWDDRAGLLADYGVMDKWAVPPKDSFMDKLVPAAILALGTAGIGSGIAGAAGLSGVAGQAVGGAIAGGVAGGINAGMNDTNLLAGIGRGALFGGLGGAAKGAFMGNGGLGSAGGGGGGGGGGDLGDLGGGLKLNSSGTGLQYPTFDPTTQLPDTLGSGVTTPDSFFPTFDAETLNLPEFLTSQTGYGLNPNTAGTGLRPPTTPGLGTMGNAQGLTLDVPDGTLSQAGLVPSGSSLYAPTNLPYDEANYISNPFTANPDPVVPNPGPEQSTLDKLTNGYKSLPPGLQSTIERLGAPLVANAIETILGGGGGGDTTGLGVGTTPDYNTDPGTGLEPGDLSAYLPYGIGWRGMKGDKAKKYSKRKAGATASPNFEEDRYGVMKIGQKRVRAQKQSTKPGRTYG